VLLLVPDLQYTELQAPASQRRFGYSLPGSVPQFQFGKQRAGLLDGEDLRNTLSFGALAHQSDRVLIQPLVAHGVIEEGAHDVSYFRFRSDRPGMVPNQFSTATALISPMR
jgi:hypothetical protein